MGEMLANKYILPDIEKYDPYLVIDVHEMESYWDEQSYVGVLDNKSSIEKEYASRISENLDYPIFTINAGTSPEWVTIPIEEKNHNVILFETPQKDNQTTKMQVARDLVRTIDALNVYWNFLASNYVPKKKTQQSTKGLQFHNNMNMK